MTRGAVGPYLLFPQVLDDLDSLRDLEAAASADPDTLTGTPCCPGVVEGVVRVVNTIDETGVGVVKLGFLFVLISYHVHLCTHIRPLWICVCVGGRGGGG